jgi:hypothetical protein
MTGTPAELTEQMSAQRRTVDFDTFDIQVQQLLTMLEQEQIFVSPAYQRQFLWDPARCSRLIESLILGIPIPNIFMATNNDNTWEVVDGLQRISTIVKFAGSLELRKKLHLDAELRLESLQKIEKFNGATFATLPPHIQQHIRTRPFKVVTLNDKSDKIVRFDLFERLNTGGIILTPQEIRACVYGGAFSDKLEELSKTTDFQTVVKLTDRHKADGTSEECVLRFFSFLDRYRNFEHIVKEFLNGYMKDAATQFNDTDIKVRDLEFRRVFSELAKAFPDGLMRPGRKGTTPINLFEGVAVGAALAMRESQDGLNTTNLATWMATEELRKYTTAATNSPTRVSGRIHFCRDRFLGRPYVPSTTE